MPIISIGANDYPAFADQDFADEFLAADVQRAAPWSLYQDETKVRGLVSASRMIAGFLVADPLPDPTADVAALPEALKEVTSMLAADLLAKPKLQANGSANSNVKTAKGGSASVEFFRPVDASAPLPDALWRMLLLAGLVGNLPDPEESGSPEATGTEDRVRPLCGRFAFDDWPWVQRDFD